MPVLYLLLIAMAVLGLGGWFYSRFLARTVGEDVSRPTPAMRRNDGRDYVPTPTAVVFAHHFASIAGAGPIVGPVIAIVYGWLPAAVWVIVGGLVIGAVHDYLAAFMSTREDGHSVATIARRLIGNNAFVALTLFLIVMLALVCATFLNLSAQALTSRLPFDRLGLEPDQTIFRVQGGQVVIGGIASMSVIIITAAAPLIGWMYIRKQIRVRYCSLAAVVVCTISIIVGLYVPVAFPQQVTIAGMSVQGIHIWFFLLSAYVLVAAGAPVWIFLQSRDFINVHILYAGTAALLLTLLIGAARGAGVADPLPALNVAQGSAANGPIWPTLFILIACGAVSGFHSLCAGGTTCKQITSERAARTIGYFGMVLESFLAVCVIAALMMGAGKANYLSDVYPRLAGLAGESNAVLGFAMAVGNSAHLALGAPVAVGALAGMVLLEGFLVTTLDTAVRLMRYLIEEVWRTMLGRFDIFAEPVAAQERKQWNRSEPVPVGADGIPSMPEESLSPAAPAFPIATMGLRRSVLKFLRHYWVNSGLAVAITLAFALTGGQQALWRIFATANQLLAAMVLALAALWLARHGRSMWFAVLPAVFMMVTTLASLVLLLQKFLAAPARNATLLTADIVLLGITAYLLFAGARVMARRFSKGPPAQPVD
jgi:carbon starvation protein